MGTPIPGGRVTDLRDEVARFVEPAIARWPSEVAPAVFTDKLSGTAPKDT